MYDAGDTPAFVKRHCLHCLEPGCASACPVSALEKDPKTGIVTYDKNACIGCRYCQVACPYNVPKFEWDNPFPQIRKCELCHHLLAEDRYAACCESCPTGASLFGPVKDLRQEAERRLNMEPGRYYDFPVNHISRGATQAHKAEPYVPTIYGADELGGTQVMLLSGVDFSTLGLPEVRTKSYVSDLESLSSKLYSYMLLPAAVFGGLLYVAKKNRDHE
jgi:Fe-S-cluster-containing dehydrogenase component